MRKKKVSPVYKFIIWLLYVFYPRMEIIGAENLPDEPCIIAANHCQMNGPIACELFFPENRYTWCAGEMMKLQDVPAYAYRDFWSSKPKYIRWFYKLLSYAIAPLAVLLFNNANTIGVYRDMKIMSTFRDTITRLNEGANIVIFPECYDAHNNIIHNFQEGFVDVARFYHRRSSKELAFVPMYIAPKLKKMVLGKPVRYNADAPIQEERKRICNCLMDRISEMAYALPRHTVVPYPNIPRKYYPSNIRNEVNPNEKTGC